MDKVLVSVIIPVYNAEKYLEECIDSILKQTYENLEVILIDDGSTDSSGKICDEYAKTDSRIKVWHLENGGVSRARNMGIEKSAGKYITFVDSDDYVESEMIANMILNEENYHADLCITKADFQKNDREDFFMELTPQYADKLLFLHENYLVYGPTSKLYRSETIKENQIIFPVDMEYGEDLIFNLNYMTFITSISYCNQLAYHYRVDNQESLSRKVRWNIFEISKDVHDKLKNWFEEKRLLTNQIKICLYERLFDCAYNTVCLTFRKDCPWSLKEKKKYLHQVIEDVEVRKSFKYIENNKYSDKIIDAIKNKKYLTLLLRGMIIRF